MNRRPIVFAAVLVVLALLVGWVMVTIDDENDVPLDPHNPGRNGAQAMASVLGDQGVSVQRVTTVEAAARAARVAPADTTVLVSSPATLSTERLAALATSVRSSARLVLLSPTGGQLRYSFDFPMRATGDRDPIAAGECDLSWAVGLTMPALAERYEAPADAATCFTRDGTSAAFEMPATGDRPAILVLGSSAPITNGTVKQGDNAAIGLRALGQTRRVVWLTDVYDAESPQAQASVWPKWIRPALWLSVAVVLLMMVWRGRRFGRLVSEPLPVIVPANETTVARGQLYRRARDPEHTAQVLRAASRVRLARFLGVPPGAPTGELVRRAADHTGRDEREIDSLLTDGPVDEATLSRLAENLSALERQARR